MKAEGIDAVVATSAENVTYTSGYWALSQWIRRGPQIYVLLPATDLSSVRNHRQHDAVGSDRRPAGRLDRECQAIRLFPGRPVECSARRPRQPAGRTLCASRPGRRHQGTDCRDPVGRAGAIPYRHRRDGIVAGTLGETLQRTSGRQAGARLPASQACPRRQDGRRDRTTAPRRLDYGGFDRRGPRRGAARGQRKAKWRAPFTAAR